MMVTAQRYRLPFSSVQAKEKSRRYLEAQYHSIVHQMEREGGVCGFFTFCSWTSCRREDSSLDGKERGVMDFLLFVPGLPIKEETVHHMERETPLCSWFLWKRR